VTLWHHAICDTHREHAAVLVTFNGESLSSCSQAQGPLAARFLWRHYACALRLAHTDEHLELIDSYREFETVEDIDAAPSLEER